MLLESGNNLKQLLLAAHKDDCASRVTDLKPKMRKGRYLHRQEHL